MVADSVYHVLGNGPGDIPRLNGVVICFNEAKVSTDRVIRISNGRKVGNSRSFIVEGPDGKQFINALHITAERLKRNLRCWPSTGLTTVLALESMQLPYVVHRMPLAPDFNRKADLSSGLANASCYHNWLGERRLAFTTISRPWTSLLLPTPQGKEKSINNPFHLLDADDVSLDTLEYLSGYSPDSWESFANLRLIEACEHFFYLPRNSVRTKNWWLYHDRGSSYVDKIFKCLAYCQQSLYMR